LYRAAVALGLFAGLASAVGWSEPQAEVVHQHQQMLVPSTPERAPCPPGTLPDADVCIPVPVAPEEQDGAALASERNAHRTRGGVWTEYEDIPRRPDRSNRYKDYRYPVEFADKSDVLSGFDLNLPDANQRRGGKLALVGHGGIDLAARRGTEVRLVNLEHQQGSADVLFVGPLIGNTVVTRHSVRESGTLREYLVFYGHLQAPASGLARGAVMPEGTVVGYVGDSGSPGAIHLHLEIRQVRSNVDSQSLARGELLLNARTIACDPRNVLPVR
jgi:murein DD-endopeptidase MepM/ murein hydrolase activator NlpD